MPPRPNSSRTWYSPSISRHGRGRRALAARGLAAAGPVPASRWPRPRPPEIAARPRQDSPLERRPQTTDQRVLGVLQGQDRGLAIGTAVQMTGQFVRFLIGKHSQRIPQQRLAAWAGCGEHVGNLLRQSQRARIVVNASCSRYNRTRQSNSIRSNRTSLTAIWTRILVATLLAGQATSHGYQPWHGLTSGNSPRPAAGGGGPGTWPCRRPRRSSPGPRRPGPATAHRPPIRQNASQVRTRIPPGSSPARAATDMRPTRRRAGYSLPTSSGGWGISAIWRCAVLPPRASALPCWRR